MENEDTLKELNENFVDIASFCFSIKANNVNSLEHIVNTLRAHYLPFEKIDHRSFNNLVQFYSDGDIGYAVHRLAHFTSRFTDVYYYKFSYIGRFSFINYPRNSPYGVNHLDDHQYVFRLNGFGDFISESDPENFMVERLTRMWEQFAKTGNPTNEDDEYLSDLKWPKHNDEDEYYLDIGVNMVEKQGLYLERYSVWDKLEVSTGNRVDVGKISIFLLIAVFLFNIK
jgi:acetylcholinesterase